MQGLITERHFAHAEQWFPGIRTFYLSMANKPLTFLELVWEYEKQASRFSIGMDEPRCQSIGRQGR